MNPWPSRRVPTEDEIADDERERHADAIAEATNESDDE